MSLLDKLRAKKLRRAEDKYDDARSHLEKWGFSMKPSENRRARDRLAGLKVKLDAAASRNGGQL